MVKVYCIKLNEEIEPGIFNNLINRFSSGEREKTLKFVRKIDRERRLIGRLLVWWIMVQDYNRYSYPEISYDMYGRPFLQNEVFDFNISHSGKWVAIGVCEKNKIGVDVQEIEHFDFNGILNYFSGEEIKILNSLSDDYEKRSKFHQIWTLKESYIKCIGSTFNIPLDKFWFIFDNNDQNPVFFSNDYKCDEFKFESCKLDNTHWLSVCIPHVTKKIVLETLNMTNLIKSAYKHFKESEV